MTLLGASILTKDYLPLSPSMMLILAPLTSIVPMYWIITAEKNNLLPNLEESQQKLKKSF